MLITQNNRVKQMQSGIGFTLIVYITRRKYFNRYFFGLYMALFEEIVVIVSRSFKRFKTCSKGFNGRKMNPPFLRTWALLLLQLQME